MLYAAGFREAAHLLAKDAEKVGVDLLVYPIVFNYRQYFELTLKRLYVECDVFDAISEGRRLEGRSYPQHHRLDTLWGDLKPKLVAR